MGQNLAQAEDLKQMYLSEVKNDILNNLTTVFIEEYTWLSGIHELYNTILLNVPKNKTTFKKHVVNYDGFCKLVHKAMGSFIDNEVNVDDFFNAKMSDDVIDEMFYFSQENADEMESLDFDNMVVRQSEKTAEFLDNLTNELIVTPFFKQVIAKVLVESVGLQAYIDIITSNEVIDAIIDYKTKKELQKNV